MGIKAKARSLVPAVLAFLIIACQQDDPGAPLKFPALMEIPSDFPPVVYPDDNAFTYDRWLLGKTLFYDPRLSADQSLSCATCHQQHLAFSDGLEKSIGIEGRLGRRNSPSLANVAYHPYFTREGGVPTLEMQVLVPIQEHDEFDFNIILIERRLAEDSTYRKLTRLAYGREPDAFAITRGLATYERSLISGNSLYDRYSREKDPELLSPAMIRGMTLFFSERTQCSSCHSGFNFTNYAFENNGLYTDYPDEGRKRLTGNEEDLARFKVPSLRNIALTAPYMHDGSMRSLKEVVAHYVSGGQDHISKNPIIRPLDLTEAEQHDLVAFLHALTDEAFIENPIFR